MGVHGLWKLIDKAGRPIPVETLENKVLAVDVSIWLYQLVRGFDSSARPGSSAFLLGLFHRICKLLFYRIKPVFVFDGGVPSLKKKTIAARQRGRRKAKESIEKVRQQLLENLVKQQALGDVLGEKIKIPRQFASRQDELFWLPPKENDADDVDEESDYDYEPVAKKYFGDLSSVDVESEEFLKLPADVRHDILTELKETRKLNSWARIHLMPEEADGFSSFQMARLLKRRAVQVSLDKAGEELGTRGLTIHDLTNILTEQGIDLSQRIAGDSTTRFIYASNPEALSQETNDESADDPSEFRTSNSSSSSSSDEISPAVRKLANAGSGGLSQTEILELIRNENVGGKMGDVPSTSKLDFTGAGKSSSLSGAKDAANDRGELRGKIISPDNEQLESDPGKIPGASRKRQLNDRGEVSPSKNAKTRESAESETIDSDLSSRDLNDGKSVDAIRTVVRCVESREKKIPSPLSSAARDDGTEISGIKIVPSSEGVDLSDDEAEPSAEKVDTLEIVVDPNAEPDDDIFADVFAPKEHSDIKPSSSVVEPLGGNRLEIVVDPDEKLDDDIFADVFSGEEENSGKIGRPSFWKLVDRMKKIPSTDDLNDVKVQLERESEKLASENKREERLTSTITEQITQDAQHLLQLFGIPYIVAPMEAEAQCAYLDLTGQTEGTITEDSDIWLFGARNVYKNFFDQRKFVKQFKATDINQCYHLNRDDLIMIAMLVGSDYTTGLAGVGPVNAIEIVAHFPKSDDALTPQKRLSKFVDAYSTSEMSEHLLRKLKTLEFFDGFPSEDVVKAYVSPVVDESREKFSWSKPSLEEIKSFMREKFGWDCRKVEQSLMPIVDRWTQSTTQKTIHNYFEWAFDVEEVSSVSKRVGKAVEILSTGEIPTSAPKKMRKVETKDPLRSSYSRRKYGKFEAPEAREAVPEGSKAARAAARAIMAATRKPQDASSHQTSEPSLHQTSEPSSHQTSEPSSRSDRPIRLKRSADRAQEAVCNRAPSRVTFKAAPVMPSLSDILCGVGSEPSPWTPSKDLVSPYVKRKYGRMGAHGSYKKDETVAPKRTEEVVRLMPSKTPAQIARERAAKKLKEAKANQQKGKSKKGTSN